MSAELSMSVYEPEGWWKTVPYYWCGNRKAVVNEFSTWLYSGGSLCEHEVCEHGILQTTRGNL